MTYHDILQIYGYIGLYGEILYEMGNIKPHHKPLFKLYAECSRTHVFLSIDTTVVKHDNSLGVFKTGLDASGYGCWHPNWPVCFLLTVQNLCKQPQTPSILHIWTSLSWSGFKLVAVSAWANNKKLGQRLWKATWRQHHNQADSEADGSTKFEVATLICCLEALSNENCGRSNWHEDCAKIS